MALENVLMESTGFIVNCRQKEETGVKLIFLPSMCAKMASADRQLD